MKFKNFFMSCSTLGKIGYLPASGTFASLIGLPLAFLIHSFSPNYCIYGGIIMFLLISGLFIIYKARSFFASEDPSQIVIDEFIGCIIAFFAIPFSFKTMVVGIILFRLFDITKIFGIEKIERIGGATGILLDDCIAGIYTNIILHGLFLLHII